MYFRQHGDHYGIGNYRHEPRLVEPEAIRPAGASGHPCTLPFTAEDFTAEDFTAAHAEARRLLPALAETPIVEAFNGLMAFPPDGMPLLGASRVRGLWLGQAIWVTHAGGAGRALAELMANGHVDVDLHECDPTRFEGFGCSRAYWRARGAQQYRQIYDVIHPRQQSEQARPLRRTPFYERETALGAHFSRARAESARSGMRPTPRWLPRRRGPGGSGQRATGRRS
jgi:dimethylglycine oxidase